MEQITFAKEDAQSVLMVPAARSANRGFGATPALDAKVRIKGILDTLLKKHAFGFKIKTTLTLGYIFHE